MRSYLFYYPPVYVIALIKNIDVLQVMLLTKLFIYVVLLYGEAELCVKFTFMWYTK